jgi:hypothetical protein
MLVTWAVAAELIAVAAKTSVERIFIRAPPQMDRRDA